MGWGSFEVDFVGLKILLSWSLPLVSITCDGKHVFGAHWDQGWGCSLTGWQVWEVGELVFRNFKFSYSPNLVHRDFGSGMGDASDSLVLVLDVKECLLNFKPCTGIFCNAPQWWWCYVILFLNSSKVLIRLLFNMGRGFHVQLTGSSVAEVCPEACCSL